MTRLNPLQQLRDLDRASPQFHEQLSSCLRGSEFRGAAQNLRGEDLKRLIEYLDSILVSISNPLDVTFQEILHEFGKICSVKGVLPKSCTLSAGSLPHPGFLPVSENAYEGILNGLKVRIKRVRIVPKGDPQKAKIFRQVAVVWKHLEHPNIVPLLGATTDPLQLVSGWMCGGDLTEYITNRPDADRLYLLSDVAEGLNYLHSCNVIHGNLKGPNVLVDAAGCARITDFGLAMVTQNLDSIRNGSDEYGHSARWIAPEILNGRGTYSKEGDVFSFAMVTVEAFTCAMPFSDRPPHAAVLAIVGGERPPRPSHPTLMDRLWDLTRQCWDQEARRRPQVQTLCSFGIPAWKRLIDRSLTTDERISLIKSIFSNHDENEMVKRLCGDDAQTFVDVIDETLDVLTPQLRGKCLNALCKICGRQALLPRSVQIPLCYDRSGTPLCRGGFGDVWKGNYKGCEVAVKVLAVYLTSNLDDLTHSFCKEVMTWRSLRHQNVLPLLGVTMCDNQFAMASQWMDNGNINQFIEAHRNVNRFELLKDVARGLAYMHGEGLVHGDLKGANILIDQDNRARLADFGLTAIIFDPPYSTTSNLSVTGGTTRWMSRERLDPSRFGFKNSRPTKESDCYALGMVILEVLSGQVPFQGDRDILVIQRVVEGGRPGRPRGVEGVWFTDDLWGMLERCWSPEPDDRPTVEEVLGNLERISVTWRPLPPSADTSSEGEVDINRGDRSSLAVSDGSTVESADASKASLLRQVAPSEELGIEGYVGIDNRVPPNYLGGHSPLRASNLSPTQDLSRQTTSRAGKDPRDVPTVLANHSPRVEESTIKVRRMIHQGTQRPAARRSTSALISLTKVAHRDGTSQDINQVLATAFRADDYLDCIKDLQARNIDPLSYINGLDKVIDGLPTGSDLRKQCIRALSGACGLYRILPASYVFSGKLSEPDRRPSLYSVNFDIWRLTIKKHQDQVFAVKSLRFCGGDPVEKLTEKYFKEVVVSKRVDHPNILPIEGVAPELFKFCMVFRWMERGDILEYVGKNPEINRLDLLIGVTRGLEYLHDNGIIHGDLKSPNILIDAKGSPRLYNFANCSFTKNTEPVNALAPTYDCAVRWSAPERLSGSAQEKEPTTMSDAYSLSMVIVELATGKMPFPEFTDHNVVVMIMRGKRPQMPHSFDAPGMTPAVWKVAQKCWHEKAMERPEVNTVLRSLEDLANSDGKHTQTPFLQRRWRDIFNN